MMLSLYSAKAIALQIRFRRIRMERPRRGGAYDVRYFFNDPPLRFHVAGTKASLLSGSFCSEVGSVVVLPDVDSHVEL